MRSPMQRPDCMKFHDFLGSAELCGSDPTAGFTEISMFLVSLTTDPDVSDLISPESSYVCLPGRNSSETATLSPGRTPVSFCFTFFIS